MGLTKSDKMKMDAYFRNIYWRQIPWLSFSVVFLTILGTAGCIFCLVEGVLNRVISFSVLIFIFMPICIVYLIIVCVIFIRNLLRYYQSLNATPLSVEGRITKWKDYQGSAGVYIGSVIQFQLHNGASKYFLIPTQIMKKDIRHEGIELRITYKPITDIVKAISIT